MKIHIPQFGLKWHTVRKLKNLSEPIFQTLVCERVCSWADSVPRPFRPFGPFNHYMMSQGRTLIGSLNPKNSTPYILSQIINILSYSINKFNENVGSVFGRTVEQSGPQKCQNSYCTVPFETHLGSAVSLCLKESLYYFPHITRYIVCTLAFTPHNMIYTHLNWNIYPLLWSQS